MLHGPLSLQAINDYAYGPEWAGRWNSRFGDRPYNDACLAFLRERCADSALEFGIGSGRMAKPLAETGATVAGIDISAEMLEELKRSPGGEGIECVAGSVCDTVAGSGFSLVYFVSWGIHALLSADEQRACIRNAAEQLAPGGRFIVDHMVLDHARKASGRSEVVRIDVGETILSHTLVHPVEPVVLMSYTFLKDREPAEVWSTASRCFANDELDSWAGEAGLVLESEHGDWWGGDFTADSGFRVAVYRKEAGDA